MGLCATEEENSLVADLNSENWPTLVPLSPLKAGYEATRHSHFDVSVLLLVARYDAQMVACVRYIITMNGLIIVSVIIIL